MSDTTAFLNTWFTEDNVDFIERAGANPIAREVKLADLEDNMDIQRIPVPGEKDFDRLAKYRRSWERLQQLARADGH